VRLGPIAEGLTIVTNLSIYIKGKKYVHEEEKYSRYELVATIMLVRMTGREDESCNASYATLATSL
jgi:hypothetical protein